MWYLASLRDKLLLCEASDAAAIRDNSHQMGAVVQKDDLSSQSWKQLGKQVRFARPTITMKLKAKQQATITTLNIVRTTLLSIYDHKRPICEWEGFNHEIKIET